MNILLTRQHQTRASLTTDPTPVVALVLTGAFTPRAGLGRHLLFVKTDFLSFYTPHQDFIFFIKFFSVIPHNPVPSLNLGGSYTHRSYTVGLILPSLCAPPRES